MPGAYAHISLVNVLVETNHLNAIAQFPKQAKVAVGKYLNFCELGAVSPDYPYLKATSSRAKAWADVMHRDCTGDLIKSRIRLLRSIPEPARSKCVAWLLGLVAHVVMDCTIHPVVKMKVGDYEGNKLAHRICELNQDAYIFNEVISVGEIGVSEHLDTGIGACGDSHDKNRLDCDVALLWHEMLKSAYAAEYKRNAPEIDKWHKSFKRMVDNIAEEGYHLPLFARHLAVNCGLTYPALADVDGQYLENLDTPHGKKHYDEIFERAVDNVGSVWALVANAIYGSNESSLANIHNCNLDTGEDHTGQLVFWL